MKVFRWTVLWVASLVLLALNVQAQTNAATAIPPAPTTEVAVVDTTATLTDEQRQQLSAKLYQARQEKNIEMAVLLIPTLDGRAIESYSLEVARTWGVGEKDKDNGVLLLIAKDDRQMRIEVGRGQEGDFTDAQAGRVIRHTLAPAFREGRYFEGIDAATSQIIAAASGREDAIPTNDGASSASAWTDAVLTAGFFGIPLLSWFAAILGRTKSWWAGGLVGAGLGAVFIIMAGAVAWSLFVLLALVVFGLGFDFIVSKNYKKAVREHHAPSWWAGGPFIGGGGGSSRGGGSFGGGSFGGGGASGSW